QTLSRLNRIFLGKQAFILDFFNDAQDILDAFLPYYTRAELTDVTDPQLIYDLQKKLDAEGIYYWSEVETFALAFFDPKAAASKLSYYCAPARERFAKRYAFSVEARQQALDYKRTAEANGDSAGLKNAEHALKEAGEQIDQLDLFRKNLQSFVRLYEFLSQIIPYEDRELEQLCVYAKHLHPLLRADRLLEEEVDLGELQLSHYRLTKRAEHKLRLDNEGGDYTLDPLTGVGSGKAHDPEKKRLSEIIEALNEIFGAEVSDEDQLQFLTGIANRISRQEDVMAQVNNHSVDQVMHGLFPKRVLDTVLDAMTDHEKLSLEVLDNETKSRAFALVILKMLTQQAGLSPR
ncbi:MAG: type I restriction endonuclease subunit R, partial [Pseudomonas sp.]